MATRRDLSGLAYVAAIGAATSGLTYATGMHAFAEIVAVATVGALILGALIGR